MPNVLLTGFESYGGRGRNPSAELVRRLDGERVGAATVVGRVLPVAYEPLGGEVARLLAELEPVAVVGTGLWPGTPMIRLERFAVNLADFEIPDNAGEVLTEAAVSPSGSTALPARLPLRRIEAALLAAGIPATVSSSAGTFLCNAVLYRFLAACATAVPVGFVHVPYLPDQVAELVRAAREKRTLELHQRSDLASMSLDVGERALRIVLEETVRAVESVKERV